METKHLPPQGQSLIASAHIMSSACPCGPDVVPIRKRQTTGRHGSQGYKTIGYRVQHKNLETA